MERAPTAPSYQPPAVATPHRGRPKPPEPTRSQASASLDQDVDMALPLPPSLASPPTTGCTHSKWRIPK
eukprot:scaffold175049_cov27-Tisochrysis_lutea.AAC.1